MYLIGIPDIGICQEIETRVFVEQTVPLAWSSVSFFFLANCY